MLSKVLLFLLPIASMGALSGGFNYDRCNATFGPLNWPNTCKTQTQGTPINLCGAIALRYPVPPQLNVQGYGNLRSMNIYNDGASIGLNFPDSLPISNRPRLTTDTIPFLVGRTPVQGQVTWILQNIHIHWGRKDIIDEGSEHYLEGQQFAAEVHFVHFNSKYGTLGSAVSSGANDALLVAGVFLQADCQASSLFNPEPTTITTIANNIATANKTPQPLSSNVILSDVFNGYGHFYTYAGSLTTPGCSEIVTWIVMKEPKSIKLASLQKIWEASTTPGNAGGELISELGNYRPLQPRNGRKVYFTGLLSEACRPVGEPEFDCAH